MNTIEVQANKNNEIVSVTVNLDKLLATLTANPQAFREFTEMAATAAFHRNGEGYKQAAKMSGEEWLVWSAKPSIRVIQADKDKAASQYHKLAPALEKLDEAGKAKFFAASGLKPFASESEMAVSFALQRAEIAARVAAETAKAKASEADALAALLKGGEPPAATAVK